MLIIGSSNAIGWHNRCNYPLLSFDRCIITGENKVKSSASKVEMSETALFLINESHLLSIIFILFNQFVLHVT